MKTTTCWACGLCLLLAVTFPLSAEIPVGEREALINLYHATGGDAWKYKQNWLGDPGSEGSWYGVSVSDDHVTRLRLPSNNLAGELPAALSNLTFLVELDLSRNQLTGQIPENLGDFAVLTDLDLSINRLVGDIPDSIGNLTGLETLDFTQNQLFNAIPSSLGNLSGLQTLSLGRNDLTGTIPSSLGNLTALTSLDLRENQLTGVLPAALASLTALTELDVSQNQLTGALPGALTSLIELQRLVLSRNYFEGPLPIFLSSLPTLIYLDLSHNQFSGQIPSSISEFQGFHTVSLTGNHFEGPIPDEIRQLEDVRLRIDWNMLYTADAGLADFLQTMLKPSGPDWEEFQITAPDFLSVNTAYGMVVASMGVPPCVHQLGERGGFYLLSYGLDPGGPYPFQSSNTTMQGQILMENLTPGETYYGILQTVAEPIPGFFWNTVISPPGNEFLLQGKAPDPTVSLTLHALNTSGIANLLDEQADPQPYPAPLLPVTDSQILAAQPPVTEGLVADGVTPLLLRVAANNVTEDIIFHLEYDYVGPGRLADLPSSSQTPDGFVGRMKVLQNGVWVRVADEASPPVFTSEEPEVFFLLEALEPGDLTGLVPGDHDVVINLSAVATDLGTDLAAKSVKVRRPPLALISKFPAVPWSGDFLTVLGESRAPEFVKVFAPSRWYLAKEVVDDALSWGYGFRAQWAVTRIDIIAHGNGGLRIRDYFATTVEYYGGRGTHYREEDNFYRGHFRRIVGLGVSHHGSELLYIALNTVRDLSVPRVLLGTLPWSSNDKDRIVWRSTDASPDDPRDVVQLRSSLDPSGPGGTPSYDPAARWHDVGTLIDPTRSPFMDYLGLTGSRYHRLFPQGTDSHCAVPDMEGNDGGLTVVSGFASYGEPRELLGGDFTQTSSPAVARHILDLLDGADRLPFGKLTPLHSLSVARWREIDSIISEVISDPALIIEAVILNEPLMKTLSGSTTNAQGYRYGIDPPAEAPLTGEVTWIAETWTEYLATTEGVSVVPDPGDSTKVTVEVDDDVAGDTSLFFSYPSTDGRVVFGQPVLVQHRSPPGTSLVGIEVEPADRTILSGQTFRPEITAVYSDGTRLLRRVNADDLDVTSSHPDVVDVSEILLWKAGAAGTSLLTVSFEGQTAVCELTVAPPAEALTFDQWRSQFYSADELADPAVSGADTDGDGDGMTVFFEYVVDGHPRMPDSGQAPVSAMVGSGSERTPALLARISSRMSDFTARVERSPDLLTWAPWYELDGPPDETDPRVLDYGDALTHYKIIFDLAPGSPADSAFYRLNIVPAQEPKQTTNSGP